MVNRGQADFSGSRLGLFLSTGMKILDDAIGQPLESRLK